ncbi:MAG: DUF2490 domain-containing protein, partial [Crocinitomicaceae bacterium]
MKKIVFVFLIVIGTNSFAQKIFSDQQHAWLTYLGNHKLTKKVGLHTEYQWRREDWFQNWQQSLLRIGIDYNINPNLSLT